MPMKITPNLWFDTQAEEAAGFYTSVFKNSRIVSVARYPEGGPGPAGPGGLAALTPQRKRPCNALATPPGPCGGRGVMSGPFTEKLSPSKST